MEQLKQATLLSTVHEMKNSYVQVREGPFFIIIFFQCYQHEFWGKQKFYLFIYTFPGWSRDSSVGIALGYGF
jgi:hypothetical protein